MNSIHLLARRPLIGAFAGLLLVSACGTAAGSTPTPPKLATGITGDRSPETTQPAPESTSGDATVASTTPSTTPSTTSLSSTSALPPDADRPITNTAPASTTAVPPSTSTPADPAPIAVVDVSGRTVFGVGVSDAVDVDAVARDVSARLGSPTTDSGWQSMVGRFDCAGSTDSRVLWWGDFRMTFERYRGDGDVRDELSAWTVGDPTLFGSAPIGDVPAPSPSKIVTLEGVGLGSTLADVEGVWANINDGGDRRLVVVDRGGLLAIGLDEADQVVGFGDGPFDCPVEGSR